MTITFRDYAERHDTHRPTWPAGLAGLQSRAARWIVATAKKVLPVIAAFAVFAAVLAATIALRLAIWLPFHFHP